MEAKRHPALCRFRRSIPGQADHTRRYYPGSDDCSQRLLRSARPQAPLAVADPELNRKIEAFEFNDSRITNFEMESSSLAGLSALMGHRAMTVCCIIAGRVAQDMNTEYKGSMTGLIETVLDRI